MVQWNSWRCTGIPVLEGSPLSKRFMMGKIIVYIGISGAQFAPQFPQIGAVVISKRVLYMTFTSNHPWKGVGWLLFPSPLARQLLGSRGVAQLAPPGRWYAGNDVDELRGTLGGGGAAAAYWRGGLYINGCQCEWHASWWLGTSFVFFGHMEVFFFFGGHFFEWWVGEATVLIFWCHPWDSSWPFCCCFHAEALQKCHGSWGYFDLNTNLVADLKVHCSE